MDRRRLVLDVLATGTALSAVLKNSVSVKTAGSGATDLSKWDLALVVLALCAVLETTFDGKIHAGTLADRYRAGDLVLQEAQMDYALSDKDKIAKETLTKKWHDAQSILEGAVIVQNKDKGGDGKPSGTMGNKPNDDRSNKPTDSGQKDQKPATPPPTNAPKPQPTPR